MAQRRTNIKGKTGTRTRPNVIAFKKVKPLTSRYLYVEARAWFDDDGKIDGAISFDSIIVRARNDADAYQLGAAKLQDQQLSDPSLEKDEDGDPVEGSHLSATLLNDYVVKL